MSTNYDVQKQLLALQAEIEQLKKQKEAYQALLDKKKQETNQEAKELSKNSNIRIPRNGCPACSIEALIRQQKRQKEIKLSKYYDERFELAEELKDRVESSIDLLLDYCKNRRWF